MQGDEIEEMTRFAVDALVTGGAERRALVREMARRWPAQAGFVHVFALARAAAAIESTFTAASPSQAAAQAGYRLAALLACDLYALSAGGNLHPDGAALIRYWRDSDDYFLTL